MGGGGDAGGEKSRKRGNAKREDKQGKEVSERRQAYIVFIAATIKKLKDQPLHNFPQHH